ncbi:MAG: hypothetical protein ACRD2J_02460 [Thermoanaerobaculia bacterium]
MWVFDGEQWIQEGAPEARKPELPEIDLERLVPELQIVEIPVPRKQDIPPFPIH